MMLKDDILEIETRKGEVKVATSRAAAMARVEATELGQARKQEKMDKRYQGKKLNSAGMAQMMGGGGSWQLGSEMRPFGCFSAGGGNVMDGGFIGFNGGGEPVAEEEDSQSEVEDSVAGM